MRIKTDFWDKLTGVEKTQVVILLLSAILMLGLLGYVVIA